MRGVDSTVTIVALYPDLLGTYGDGGNALILAQRLRWRSHRAEVLTVRSGDEVPATAEIYVLGGGEDLPQSLAARQLSGASTQSATTVPVPERLAARHRQPLQRAVDEGAAVFAVCAGLQILGTSFVGPDGVRTDGVGLVDAETTRASGPRAVGELVVVPSPSLRLPVLSGYENHGGVTRLGPTTSPLGVVRSGVGNGRAEVAGGPLHEERFSTEKVDGFIAGRVVGTYLHGPALARNPALADHLLTSVVGALEPLDDSDSDELRAERLAVASRGRRAVSVRGWHRAPALARSIVSRR